MLSKSKYLVAGSRMATANTANAVAVLQRTKQQDGSYIISLPINTSDEVVTNLQTGETLTERLMELNGRSMGVLQDLTTILLYLSPIITEDLHLNHIYRENFKTSDKLVITAGEFEPGGIHGENISFELKDGIQSIQKPVLLSIKDIKSAKLNKEVVKVLVTANFKDSEPLWFDCTEQYLSNNDITIPLEYKKEEDKPWCINVKFQIENDESVSVSDLVIAHI